MLPRTPNLNFRRLATLSFSLLCMQLSPVAPVLGADDCGPQNLLKTMKTPFSVGNSNDSSRDGSEDQLGRIGFQSSSPLGRRLLSDRLGQIPLLYLPEKMVLGRVAEFTVKGKPGKWVALAMADKNTGSKPVLGHELRLGPDRKVVSLTQIPDSGVATLLVETPIEGDLVGSNLYFEAAVWGTPDMHDVEIAHCVPTQGGDSSFNGVLIAPQFEHKKFVNIVPTTVPTRPANINYGQIK